MARDKTKRLLDEIVGLRDPDPKVLSEALGTKSGPVLAAAARRIDAEGWVDWLDPLEQRFSGLAEMGRSVDPGCAAKLAIVEALHHHEQPAWLLYHQAAKLRQMEPVWGGQEDSASGVRATATLALVHTRGPDAMLAVADALADESHRVRAAGALAAGDSGDVCALPLLRLKLGVGDEDPEVLATVVGSLLLLDAEMGLKAAEDLLNDPRGATREAVGVVLGESRKSAGFPLLSDWWGRALTMGERATALTAISLLRQPEGRGFLLGLVADAHLADARAALRALAIFSEDPVIADAVKAIQRTDLDRTEFGFQGL